MKYRRKNSFKAFTLIELLVVISIIGILATIMNLYFYQAKSRANYARVTADMTEIAKSVKVYAVQNNNVYPFEVPENTVPTDLESYFNNNTFPSTPCKGSYYYDYQNWLAASCEANSDKTTASDYVVGINFMKVTTSGSLPAPSNSNIYYYDVKNFANSCSEDINTATAQNGGANIFDVTSKEITCRE